MYGKRLDAQKWSHPTRRLKGCDPCNVRVKGLEPPRR